jgi:nitrite reductase/ring-hydroxylating ferredoxin subunit
MLSKFVKVAKTGELAEGKMIMVKAENDEILLAWVGGKYYAINNICSHQGGWLDQGDLHAESLEIQCPLHDGRFDLQTGQATREPCIDAVDSYGVRVEGDDILVGPRQT